MVSKKLPFERQPLTIYQSATLKPGTNKMTFDFGASSQNRQVELLYDMKESELVEKALDHPAPLAPILQELGIHYPNCWIMLNVPTRKLIKEWNYVKLGDVDLISGNIKDGRFSPDYVVALQVKVRKVKIPEELKSFSSGRGTRQTYYTALMGFDRTLLLHFIVREPQPLPEGFAPSWSPIFNSYLVNAIKACAGAIKEQLEKGRELFGYGWLGWGQAYNEEYKICGGFSSQILSIPPLRPMKDTYDVRKAREFLNQSLTCLLKRQPVDSLPYIWKTM